MQNLRNVFYKNPVKSAALLGGLFALGFAPAHFWVLSMFALAGLVLLVEKSANVKQIAKIGFSFGFVFYILTIHWIARSFYIDMGTWWLAAPLGVLAVSAISVYLSSYIVLSLLAYKKLPSILKNPLSFALIWLFFECVRAHLPSVFPWNLAGYMWADNDNLIQIASLGEVWLMSFAVVLASALLVWRGRVGVVLACVVVFSAWGFGYSRLAHANLQPLGFNVSLVQANIPQEEKWDRNLRMQHIHKYIKMSRVEKAGETDLVIWPEMAVLYDVKRNETFRRQLAEKVNAPYFLFGGLRVERGGYLNKGYQAYNGAFLVNKEGDVLHEFNKQKLLPYGEYIPFRQYLPGFAQELLARRMDYVAGLSNRLVSLPNGKKGLILICGESSIPNLAEADYLEADVILNITNDSWFDFTAGPMQHFEMSKIRAVASKKPVLRIANTGTSAVIDRYGRVLKRLDMRQQGVLKWYIEGVL